MALIGEPVKEGNWGISHWELYIADELPSDAQCTAVGCVAIVDLGRQRVAMTRNTRSGDSWEMPAGHVEPGEQPWDALQREAHEEAGFAISDAHLFAYRRITRPTELDLTAQTARVQTYPNPGYLPYYYAFTQNELASFTGEEISEARTFTVAELRQMTESGGVQIDELVIIELGLHAALREKG
jgi:8-oxo-dGTP pyrophosphatase MutT (NUDIX family)